MSAVLEHPVWLDEVTRRWQQVLADKTLADLPFKIETNRSGQLIMSPAKNIHGRLQVAVALLLETKLGGKAVNECSVATPEGVKVADVAWLSKKFFAKYGFRDPFAVAPEICVEIRSPSNSRGELLNKVRLYLDAGAREVWLVSEDGKVEFHDVNGPQPRSSFGVDVPPLL
ncbi:MAG: Uma2 family endonuclease [Burkholderiales bacterium]|jgi:Uma2 family endonuclease|nr:Uma2 family endonuclease [Burkholderiales bacterium]